MTTNEYSGYETWKGWGNTAFGKFERADAIYYSRELARSGVRILPGIRILEVGFGNGSFAGWATSQGFIYKGTEVISELVEHGRKCGFDTHLSSVSLDRISASEPLDLVIAIDVLEHIDRDQLQSLLHEAKTNLRGGGLIVARVPSGDSPFSGAIQHGDLTHKIILGSSAVRQLARQSGLEVLQIRAPVLPLRGLGALTMIRRFLIHLVRALTYPIIDKVFMGGGDPVLSPNLLFVLRKP
jgi:2-polyprenyl-3-methyl-5-hydroxy-6-metoxy-1,4-benzoquinol methylase